VVEAQQPEHGGVEIVDMDLVLSRLEPELVSRSMDVAARTPPPAIQVVKP